MSTLVVSVTQDDINNGQRGNPWSCPIALAAKRALHEPELSVDGCHLNIEEYGAMVGCFDLPDECSEFVRAFDDGEAVQPFEFAMSAATLRARAQAFRDGTLKWVQKSPCRDTEGCPGVDGNA
jgi:hypothetical protein